MARRHAPLLRLHPDFGPCYGAQPVPYGIPITIVRAAPARPVAFDYADESDEVRYPLSRSTRIEGGWNADGDRHAIVVDADTCRLYETWNTAGLPVGLDRRIRGHLEPSLEPPAAARTWTSADAAGLPDPARTAALGARCAPAASITRSASRPT